MKQFREVLTLMQIVACLKKIKASGTSFQRPEMTEVYIAVAKVLSAVVEKLCDWRATVSSKI